MRDIAKMRWILTGILVALVAIQMCVCGCYEQPKFDKEGVQEIDFDKPTTVDHHPVTAKRVRIGEHDYIFIDGSKWCNGVVHDPDCARCDRRNRLGL